MRATLMKETVKALFPQQRTLCIEGSPGGGKTTIVHEVADDLGVECRELHMPTMLVEDFGINHKRVKHQTKGYCCSMIETKQVQTCRRCWLTSVKRGLYMDTSCQMVGRLSLLATGRRTEQGLIVCCHTYVTERQSLTLIHTLMTGVLGQ
jgi:hypothetical protein